MVFKIISGRSFEPVISSFRVKVKEALLEVVEKLLIVPLSQYISPIDKESTSLLWLKVIDKEEELITEPEKPKSRLSEEPSKYAVLSCSKLNHPSNLGNQVCEDVRYI